MEGGFPQVHPDAALCSQPAGGPGMQRSPSLNKEDLCDHWVWYPSLYISGIPLIDIQSMSRVKSNKLV